MESRIDKLAKAVEDALNETIRLRSHRIAHELKIFSVLKKVTGYNDPTKMRVLNTSARQWIQDLRQAQTRSSDAANVQEFKGNIENAIARWKAEHKLDQNADIKEVYHRSPDQHTEIKFLYDAQWLARLYLLKIQADGSLISPQTASTEILNAIKDYKKQIEADIIHNARKEKLDPATMQSRVDALYNEPPKDMRVSQKAWLDLLKELAKQYLQNLDKKTEHKEEKIDAPRKSSKPS